MPGRKREGVREQDAVSTTNGRAVSLHDIDDVDRFVRAAVHRRPGKPLDRELEDELVREGIVAMLKLAQQYKPGFGGRDPAKSRFSGFAAKYLPGKLDDALHRLRGDVLATRTDAVCPAGCELKLPIMWTEGLKLVCPSCQDVELVKGESRREWDYAQAASSLDSLAETSPAGLDGIRALRSEDVPEDEPATVDLLARLGAALDAQHQRDRKRVLGVAGMLNEGHTIQDIASALGVRVSEVHDAVDRMRRVAHHVVQR